MHYAKPKISDEMQEMPILNPPKPLPRSTSNHAPYLKEFTN